MLILGKENFSFNRFYNGKGFKKKWNNFLYKIV